MKYIKWIAAATLTLSGMTVSATSLDPNAAGTTTINDNYIGAGYGNDYLYDVLGSRSKYDVDKMLVARENVNGQVMLTVDIFTSFWNDINYNNIKLGDLFMATTNDGSNPWQPNGSEPYQGDRFSNSNSNNTGTNWNYVYDLSGDRSRSSGTGALKSGFTHYDTTTSSNLGVAGRDDQSVMLYDRSGQTTHSTSNWGFGDSSDEYYIGSRSYRNLRLQFDVSGTSLATANQIAFRWAMTCANDIIEGLASFSSDDTVKVSAPQTALLFLLGTLGLAATRRKKNQ